MEKMSNSNPFNNSLLVPIAVSCIVLLPAKGEVLAGEKNLKQEGKIGASVRPYQPCCGLYCLM